MNEFKDSMYKYKKNIESAIEDPKKYKEELVEKYSSQYEEIKIELNNQTKKINENLEEKESFYVLKDLSNRSLDYFYVRDGYSFVNYLKRDSIDFYYFLDDLSDKSPFISPLKREINQKIDNLRFQGMFYESAIRSSLRKR